MMVWLILLVAAVTASATSQRCLYDGRVECECRNYNSQLYRLTHLRNENDTLDNEIFDPECNESFNCQSVQKLYNFPPPTVNSEASMVVKGYQRQGDSLYKFHTTSMTWENARRKCEEEGAHLAIINTESEAEILKQLIIQHPDLPNVESTNFAYIGFHDMYNEGEFLTIFGEPLRKTGFSEWTNNNPDNFRWNNDGHPGEDCGSLKYDGRLNDLECDYHFAFICELEDNLTTVRDGINYSTNAYKALEKMIRPPTGTRLRTDPGDGYEYFPNIGFYRLHTNTDIWQNARRTCENEGAHLAIVNSDEEAQVLKEMLQREPWIQDTPSSEAAFVGFHDQYSEGHYLTIYGDPLESTGYMHWYAPNQPDNRSGGRAHSGQDCGSIHRNGGLDDLDCNRKYAFFCEKELFY